MLATTIAEALATDLEVELCGEPDPRSWYQGPAVSLEAQGGGGLGERLARAAERVIGTGQGVLLIGSDCPDLDRAHLEQAAAALRNRDAVIHPTVDGGYALLGLRRFDRSLFTGIEWSTARVAAQTLDRMRALGWTVDIGATLRDIDAPADLEALPR